MAMADEARIPSNDFDSPPPPPPPPPSAIANNKRKFDDAEGGGKESTRISGFSDSPHPPQKPGVYSNVPPPLSDFELAKQKAAQIAARLVGSAPPGAVAGGAPPASETVKRSRFDKPAPDDRGASNGSSNERSYGEVERASKFHDHPTDAPEPYFKAPDFQQASYHNHLSGYSESKRMDVPNAKVGIVIGKGGETIKNLQYQSGARIQVTRDADADPTSENRQVEIVGTAEQISRAEQLIKDVIAEASAGAPAFPPNRGFGAPPSGEQVNIRVPNSKVGLIIGRGGETIRSLQSRSGAHIQLAFVQESERESEHGALERIFTLTGTKQQTDMASELVKELIDENRQRGAPMHSGFNQPYLRPPGPPHWGPPPRNPGYGYQQRGTYSVPPYQYPPGPPPQQYGGYSQPPTGYNAGWNQGAPASSQQPPQQASYDSYPQQSQMQQAPQSETSTPDGNYGYSQQGYYDGYQQQQPPPYQQQGYQQGYGEPQQAYSKPQPGYNQPQEGYTQPQESYTQPHEGYTQPQDSYSQPQEGYTQPQQDFTNQQGNYVQGYSQQAYTGGYEYSQASKDQQAYSQQGYSQQSYTDPSQYFQPSEGSFQQPAASSYNPNAQSAVPQGKMPSAAQN